MRRKWIKKCLLVMLLLVVSAVGTLPYWLAAAARPVLRAHGLQWTHHVNRWRTLTLRDVSYTHEVIVVDAGTVTLKMPAFWMAGLARGERSGSPFLRVDDWVVQRPAGHVPVGSNGVEPIPPGTDRIVVAGRLWNALARWIPRATFRNGVVRLLAETGIQVEVPLAEWKNATFQAAPVLVAENGPVLVTALLSAQMRWPAQGHLQLTLEQVGTIPAGLLPPAIRANTIPIRGKLQWQGGWDRGPVAFTWRQTQAFQMPDQTELESVIAVDGGINGMELRRLDVKIDGERVLHADGRIPLVISASPPENRFRLDQEAPFHLRASTVPGASFWSLLEDVLPVQLGNPVLFADMDGTIADLRGNVRVTADAVGLADSSRWMQPKIPPLTDLHLDLVFSEAAAVLERLSFRLVNQPVQMTARLPLGGEVWRELLVTHQLPHWSRLEGTLRIQQADIAALSDYMPTVISPVGTLSADLRFLPGGHVFGSLDIEEAATRPIMPLGTIAGIRGAVQFDGRSVTVTHLTGLIGDRQVSVAGDARLQDDLALDYSLRLTGENIPVIRRPGLMLRGDLDITAVGSSRPERGGQVDGSILLRNGYYLSEWRLPTIGNVTVPAQRPPFFSVEGEPFANWVLDLAIRGDGFMKVRSPVFNGLLNADFRLGGTLREPLATGVLTIDHGSIRFPFATLGVERGTVRLTQQDPYHAQLQIMSAGRVFGYDIRMNLQGQADEPVLVFTATPPLSSDAVLMMLTAGVLPERELTFTGQQRAARLALFLGQNLLYELTGDESVGDRLIIESGRNISRQGRETYAIRYRLSDRLSVTGEYDEYDAINAGIRLRMFTR